MATFAIAALVVAVLFADRLGPPSELRRRFYQIGLAVTVALFVVAISAVAVPSPDSVPLGLSFSSEDEAAGGALRERLSVIVGAGLVLLLATLYWYRALPTIAVGAMLGSLVLLMSSVSDTSGGLITFYYAISLDGGEARNAAYAGITGIGVLLLLLYGFNEWDRSQDDPALEEEAA